VAWICQRTTILSTLLSRILICCILLLPSQPTACFFSKVFDCFGRMQCYAKSEREMVDLSIDARMTESSDWCVAGVKFKKMCFEVAGRGQDSQGYCYDCHRMIKAYNVWIFMLVRNVLYYQLLRRFPSCLYIKNKRGRCLLRSSWSSLWSAEST
jgi:hypothetical protein